MAGALKKGEQVFFFPSCAAAQEDGKSRRTVIHAWVFMLKQESLWRKGALSLFCKSLGLRSGEEENQCFRSRAQYFLADNKSRKQLSIRIGGQVLGLLPSKRNGHSLTPLALSGGLVQTSTAGKPHELVFHTAMDLPDARSFSGEIYLVPGRGISVVSDIDSAVARSTWQVFSDVAELPSELAF